MPTFTVSESAAASAINTNLLQGHRAQSAPVARRVRRIGLTGSAAVNDSSVDLFYGSQWMGTFKNTTAGAAVLPKSDGDMFYVDPHTVLQPNEPLNLLISDAGATNILNCTLEVEELPRRRY